VQGIRGALEENGKPHDFGAAKLKAAKAPMLFIQGDAEGVRLDARRGNVPFDRGRRDSWRSAVAPLNPRFASRSRVSATPGH
jgi:hypothetical protein